MCLNFTVTYVVVPFFPPPGVRIVVASADLPPKKHTEGGKR